MSHTVQVEDTFRGPMDLLLHLVKRDEIDIHDIPISRLTRSYLEEMKAIQDDLDVEVASEFMAMASMLIEIKGRMLLPTPEEELGDDDEESFDPREGLVKALLEYKRFKEAAAALGVMAEEHAQRFARIAPRPEHLDDTEDGIDDVSPNDLLVAFQNMLEIMLEPKEADQIVYDEVPTEVRVRQIMDTLEAAEYTAFSKLLSSAPTRGEMVGFFVALLELIRQRKVVARQSGRFCDILIERHTGRIDVPPPEPTTSRLRKAIESAHAKPTPALFSALATRQASPCRRGGATAFLAFVHGPGEYRLTTSTLPGAFSPVPTAGKTPTIRLRYGGTIRRLSTEVVPEPLPIPEKRQLNESDGQTAEDLALPPASRRSWRGVQGLFAPLRHGHAVAGEVFSVPAWLTVPAGAHAVPVKVQRAASAFLSVPTHRQPGETPACRALTSEKPVRAEPIAEITPVTPAAAPPPENRPGGLAISTGPWPIPEPQACDSTPEVVQKREPLSGVARSRSRVPCALFSPSRRTPPAVRAKPVVPRDFMRARYPRDTSCRRQAASPACLFPPRAGPARRR